ncbi:carbohydrate-binding module family 20 domain-containing protein [Catenovulum sediminis]|uniref:carbohydrate-binding module family 20 domain-containing protein n=1 Tax=Catenovulum sediminis TaxID=1740262 RepID=UPI00118139E1|nr:carbohydrate-binding module family 20 domain-containing protein [Catenovulum sediminis]
MKHLHTLTRMTKSLLAATALSSVFVNTASADAMLHAFNWQYDDVSAKAQEIADLGYKSVLVSPPYLSNPSSEWWARYQPLDYRILLGPLGTKQDFQDMIDALEARGVNLYVDVIFNHMANMNMEKGQEQYPGFNVNTPEYEANKVYGDLSQGLFGPGDFHDGANAKCISDWGNWYDSTWNRLCGAAPDKGLPDLRGEATDATGDWIRSNQIAYLNALKAMGVDGFRIDAVKHMKWEHLNWVFNSDVLDGIHVFSEIISHSSADDNTYLQPYLDNTDVRMGAYDFRLFNELDHAFDMSGSLSSLSAPNTLPSDRAVTFVITHDMPQNDGFNGFLFSEDDEKLAYAYILGRDGGVPLIYTDNNETPKFNSRWVDAYKDADLVNMIKFHNQVQGQEMEVLSANGCAIYFRRGNIGLVGINKCGNSESHSLNVAALNVGTYTDQISGSTLNISGTNQTVSLPARSVRMWLNGDTPPPPPQGWFFSGTANNWAADSMTVDGSVYKIIKTFSTGDANGGPRFKIRDSATDWDVNFPAQDFVVTANKTYEITFDPSQPAGSKISVIEQGPVGGSCPVKFTCQNGNTNMGDSVYVSGSAVELGSWNSDNAALLAPTNYPTWDATINLPANTDVSWKCIVRQESSPFTVRQWEVDPNNNFNTGNCDVTEVSGSF